ncbi:hypothetical protein NPIL_142631 [Nephila pilipes]|uniref:Uncharacterized protein n=1 Tax=Nephila pilipes TaxID=299642 RepID=A0A8X6PV87_NEPPI|nr:hypothetical protein NPIL_142631 [Nephila pilipes]
MRRLFSLVGESTAKSDRSTFFRVHWSRVRNIKPHEGQQHSLSLHGAGVEKHSPVPRRKSQTPKLHKIIEISWEIQPSKDKYFPKTLQITASILSSTPNPRNVIY